MHRLVRSTAIAAAAALAALVPVAASAAPASNAAAPAIEMKTSNLGKVIATPARLGIYYWTVEKKAGGKIKCTGSCAAQWPPVYVNAAVPKHIAGVMATLGTITRGSKLQLTVNGLPAYTFSGDKAGVVKCNNVDGWFAVKA
jgi:predicted lipoprotein with Yx(FWY)xxD motif